jgi:hypothetical protein
MTNRERENCTLSFSKPPVRGAVQETFYPWTLTIKRFKEEGLPHDLADNLLSSSDSSDLLKNPANKYLNIEWGRYFFEFEKHMGFDAVRRIGFTLPFYGSEDYIVEETSDFIIKENITGKRIKYDKVTGKSFDHHPIVTCQRDWDILKKFDNQQLEELFTDKNISDTYSPLMSGHKKGEYSIRMNIYGFFWTPRTLLGIEPHLYAFYDAPELMHDINTYILDVYLDKLVKILEIVPADVIYLMEDLSGSNGPMLSPAHFDEFVGSYYKRLIPVLKQKGVKHVFVDTDGDFTALIPNFIEAGIDGFLPMDVNAGMNIIKVREQFPQLKFIGGFNKLSIATGREAIDREFERLIPVIRQGGYVPGTDHQVAPSTSFADYKYYIQKLKEVMTIAGSKS